MKYPGKAVRLGDRNAQAVRLVQTTLARLSIDPGPLDGKFGARTLAAVRLFQTTSGLEPDGIVGRLTWAELFTEDAGPAAGPSSFFVARALVVVQGELGEVETSPNQGTRIGVYQDTAGVPHGSRWCQCLVYFGLKTAADELGMTCPAARTGGVREHWDSVPERCRFGVDQIADDSDLVAPGTIFFIDHGQGQRHNGFVVDRMRDQLTTYEGNTRAPGAKVDGTYQRTRRLSEINLGVVDYGRLLQS